MLGVIALFVLLCVRAAFPNLDLGVELRRLQRELQQSQSTPSQTKTVSTQPAKRTVPLPDNVAFRDMLDHALSTRSLTVTEEEFGAKPVVKQMEATNPAQAVLCSSVTYPGKVDYYATLDAFYLKGTGVQDGHGQFTDRWVALKAPGHADKKVTYGTNMNVESVLFGQVPFGNYTADQRARLLSLAAKASPYSFNEADITETTIDGVPVYAYKITLHVDEAVALGRAAAKEIGAPQPDWKYSAPYLAKLSTYYISRSDHHLVRIVEVYGEWKSFADAKKYGSVRTLTYSGYDTTAVPPTPTGVLYGGE